MTRAQLDVLHNTPGLLTFENETELKDPLLDVEGAELDFIHMTPAATPAGAAVKLRGLADENGLAGHPSAFQYQSSVWTKRNAMPHVAAGAASVVTTRRRPSAASAASI